jgi:putative membrane protein
VDVDNVETVDDLKDAVAQMEDGMSQLLDGSDQLTEGLEELLTGANNISDGVTQLSDGLGTLTANNDALNGGADQVFTSLLSMANKELTEAGINAPALTVENYGQVLDGVLASLDENSVIATARTQVEAAVREQEDAVRAAVTEAVQEQVAQQVTAAVRQQVEQQVIASMGLTAETVP